LHDPAFNDRFGTLGEFQAKCQSGDLPSYSFLEPNYGGPAQNDQHPPSDIRAGEQLIADVYNMVRSSPAFEQTMLFITYDEHGGCYDHVAPPGGARNPDPNNLPGQDGFLFNRFGLRVPCVVVSPYIPKGLIARPEGYTPFDHTSIIRTIQACFGLEGSLTERDKAAPDFSGLLTLESPRRDDIPEVEPLEPEAAPGPGTVNELHRLMANILEDITGKPKEEEKLLHYIQTTYRDYFS
jgi:phospholipase C